MVIVLFHETVDFLNDIFYLSLIPVVLNSGFSDLYLRLRRCDRFLPFSYFLEPLILSLGLFILDFELFKLFYLSLELSN